MVSSFTNETNTEMTNWNDLEPSIRRVYKNNDKKITIQELDYLKEAYSFTENLWLSQIAKIDKVEVVMISEAPLFGKNKNYFYNLDTKFSSFFNFNDIIEVLDIQCEKEDYNNKEFAINALNKKGFLILDIFPFALNPEITELNFKNLKKNDYQVLFGNNLETYIEDKLQLIKSKSNEKIVFAYRYKRLRNNVHELLKRKIIQHGLIQSTEPLEALNNNMSLDRKKLKEIINSNNT